MVILFAIGSFSVTIFSYLLGVIGIFKNLSTIGDMLSSFFSSFFG